MQLMFASSVLALSSLVSGVVGGEESFFDSNGVKIRYITAGKGEVVVLLHGFAASANMWGLPTDTKAKVFPELAKSFCVIAVDCRGHGKSGKPNDPKQYGMEMVKDVIRLLDHLGIKKAHVLGYSMGAEIAGKLLTTYPDRLLSVTLGGGIPLFEPTKESIATMELAAKSLEENKGIGPAIIAGTPLGVPKPSLAIADMISKTIIGDQDQKALAASVRGAKECEVAEAELTANKVPVLVIYGSKDGGEVNQERFGRVAKLLNAKVQVVKGGDHVSTTGMPEFQESIQRFFRMHAGASPD